LWCKPGQPTAFGANANANLPQLRTAAPAGRRGAAVERRTLATQKLEVTTDCAEDAPGAQPCTRHTSGAKRETRIKPRAQSSRHKKSGPCSQASTRLACGMGVVFSVPRSAAHVPPLHCRGPAIINWGWFEKVVPHKHVYMHRGDTRAGLT